jgi:hypothetical protein
MSTDQDTARIVRSWLQVDEHESADGVLEAVFALLDATPQRRSWWPARRIGDMNSFLKVGIAAAAIVVVAIAGVAIFNRDSRPGVVATPTPSASTESQTPEPTPDAHAYLPSGSVEVGRHGFSLDEVRFSFEIPTPGWISSAGAFPEGANLLLGIRGQPTATWLLIWAIDGVYADPCNGEPAPVAGPTAADLAAEVAGIPGIELVDGPTDVTVGGQPAKHVVIRIPRDIPCAPDAFRLWYVDAECQGDDPCYRWASQHEETHYIWIVDAVGGRVWIEAETYGDPTPGTMERVQGMIDSIQFE